MNLGTCLVSVVESLPFGWISAIQIVINMDGIVKHGSPVKGSVSLNLVSEAFCIWVSLPVKAITIAPSRWGVQIEINRVSNQMIWVWSWWNNGTTNVLTFSSESMSDPDGDWTLSGETVHFVHFRFESFVNFDSKSIVSLDSWWTVSDQVATARSTATTGGATALSCTWTTTKTTGISTGWTFVGIVLTFATLVSASFVVVTVFCILTISVTWLTASNVTCTTAKTSFPTSSAKVVIPVQACASNTSTLGIVFGDIFRDLAGKSSRGK